MDPVGLATSLVHLKAAEQASSIQYAVAAKILRVQRETGANVAKLVEAAGRQIDNAAQSLFESINALDVYA